MREPENFSPRFEVVSCFLEHNGQFLLLHRHDHKPQGNTWGIPAGKVENGEELTSAIVREIYEETSLDANAGNLKYFKKVFVRYDDCDFIYHMFHYPLQNSPNIKINNEHKDFCWASPADSLKLNLIQDEDACIKLFYGV